MSFFQELRRRNVFRVAATYAIVAWLLIQIAVSVFPTLQLPAWTATLVTVLLILGFPIALVLAWAFELTPDGIRRSAAPQTAALVRGGAVVDYALIAGLVLVVGVSAYGMLRSTPGTVDDASVSAQTRPSIAVLPFADMSPDGDQQYFGDGIADELLNELANLDGIDVESRTSSFALRDRAADITEIGATLGVGTVLEGSVRKSGDTLRITAQLIDVASGNHLWSQTFEREFTDIFAVQESIARQVASTLGVQFGIAGTNAFRGAGTRSVDAYELFLRGVQATNPQNIDLLRRAVELDPDYAAAWAALGVATVSQVWTVLPDKSTRFVDEGLEYVNRAIELDPNEASAHTLLGTMLYTLNQWSEAERAQQRGLQLRVSPESLDQNGALRFRAGRITAALQRWDEAESISPLPRGDDLGGFRFYYDLALGRFAEAADFLAVAPAQQAPEYRLMFALSAGTPADVRSAIASINAPPVAVTRLYRPLLERFDDPAAALAMLRELYADPIEWPSKWFDIARLAAWFGDAAFAVELAARAASFGSPRRFILWMPFMAEARTLPEFKQLVTDINLVEYWREYGWSDFCQPLGENDFVCN